MFASRRVSLLVWGFVGLGVLIGAVGCKLTFAVNEKEAAQADALNRADKQPGKGPGVQTVGYRPGAADPKVLPPNTLPLNGPPPPASPPGPGCGPNGCGAAGDGPPNGAGGGRVPTEKEKVSQPPYVIEPPDILLLQPIRLVPRPPYTVGPFDVLLIRVAQPLPNQPVEGTYTIGPDGTINLGYSYGLVRVSGLTLEDVEKVIRAQLVRSGLRDPQVAIGLAQFRGVQQTRGQHIVRMDGTINLGSYGCVYVAGLTLAQAKVAIERHLSQYLLDPEISIDVGVYNSKAYYVITDGAGYGESVFRLPYTGYETVLDALAQIQGLPAVSSKKHIWVARPAPANHPCSQILPVDWKAITQAGVTATNYQIFPGDRIYVKSDPLIRFDNQLAKILAPVERIFGATLLGAYTYRALQGTNGANNNNGGIGFIAPLR